MQNLETGNWELSYKQLGINQEVMGNQGNMAHKEILIKSEQHDNEQRKTEYLNTHTG